MFASLKSFLIRHRGFLLFLGILTVVVLIHPYISFAFGADAVISSSSSSAASTASSAPKSNTEYLKLIQDKLGLVLQYLGIVLWPILLMIGGLLDSDVIFGGGMEDRLLMVWTPIRNFVNIGFVLILLVIGLYNILGRSEGEYSLKQALPKFAMALIAINFSFLACRVVIDASNVLTGAVASLPIEFISDEQLKTVDKFKEICAGKWDEKTQKSKMPAMCEGKDKLTVLAEGFFSVTVDTKNGKVTQKNLPFVMAMIMVGQFEYVAPNVENYISFIINLIDNVLLGLIYAISFVVLFFVLLARVVVLWTMTALSPLIGLLFILPQGIKSELSGEADIQKIFIQHAIAPIGIVAAMSIGFIMNMALKGATVPAILSIKLGELDPSLKVVDIENLHKLLIALATIAIVWTGVFAAANKTMAKVVTEGIQQTGAAIGKFAATAWQYLPILPAQVAQRHGIKEEDVPSWAGLKGFVEGVPGAFRSRASGETDKMLKAAFPWLNPGDSYMKDFSELIKHGKFTEAANVHREAIAHGIDVHSADFQTNSKALLTHYGVTLPSNAYNNAEEYKKALFNPAVKTKWPEIFGKGMSEYEVNKLFEENSNKKKDDTEAETTRKTNEGKFVTDSSGQSDVIKATGYAIRNKPTAGRTSDLLQKSADKASVADVKTQLGQLKSDENLKRLDEMQKMVEELKTKYNFDIKDTDYLVQPIGSPTVDMEQSEEKLKSLYELKVLAANIDAINPALSVPEKQLEANASIKQARTKLAGNTKEEFDKSLNAAQASGNLPAELGGKAIANKSLIQAWFTDPVRSVILPVIKTAEAAQNDKKSNTDRGNAEEDVKKEFRTIANDPTKALTYKQDMVDYIAKVNSVETLAQTTLDIFQHAKDDALKEKELSSTSSIENDIKAGAAAYPDISKRQGAISSVVQQYFKDFKSDFSKEKSIDKVMDKIFPGTRTTDETNFINEVKKEATKKP